MNYDVGVDV